MAILLYSAVILIAFSPLAFAAPPRPSHSNFGESKHFIEEENGGNELANRREKPERMNGEGTEGNIAERMEEVLEELADLAEEEKGRIEELEQQNEEFKEELGAMGVNVEENDGGGNGENGGRKAQIGMNERDPGAKGEGESELEGSSEGDEAGERSKGATESLEGSSGGFSKETSEGNGPKMPSNGPKAKGRGRPFQSEFNIQQTINNNSEGKITVQNNYARK